VHFLNATLVQWSRLHRGRFVEARGDSGSRLTAELFEAPAQAAADIELAMGARGTAASAGAADVVLLIDQLDRVVPAIKIARRAKLLALESVYAGIGISIVGMTRQPSAMSRRSKARLFRN
jgi:hypothetical protein